MPDSSVAPCSASSYVGMNFRFTLHGTLVHVAVTFDTAFFDSKVTFLFFSFGLFLGGVFGI